MSISIAKAVETKSCRTSAPPVRLRETCPSGRAGLASPRVCRCRHRSTAPRRGTEPLSVYTKKLIQIVRNSRAGKDNTRGWRLQRWIRPGAETKSPLTSNHHMVGERGMLYLDGDDVPTMRHSSVDLPDRCCSKGRVIEFPKLVTPVATKFLLHHKGQLLAGHVLCLLPNLYSTVQHSTA
jgi:hypothetical protein